MDRVINITTYHAQGQIDVSPTAFHSISSRLFKRDFGIESNPFCCGPLNLHGQSFAFYRGNITALTVDGSLNLKPINQTITLSKPVLINTLVSFGGSGGVGRKKKEECLKSGKNLPKKNFKEIELTTIESMFLEKTGLSIVEGKERSFIPIAVGRTGLKLSDNKCVFANEIYLIQGLFKVDDSEIFERVMQQGIGKNRSYGFGLITAKN